MSKIAFPILILICAVSAANAQFRLPPFEISAKGGFTALFTDDEGQQMINIQGALQVPINQYLSVGWIYERTAYGTSYDREINKDYATRELITGPEVRISAGRSRPFRPYLSLSYTKFEIVTDFESYRNACKTNALGAHIGVMLKLGSRMYLNLVEVGVQKLNDEPFWLQDAGLQAEIKTGVTYNFGKRK